MTGRIAPWIVRQIDQNAGAIAAAALAAFAAYLVGTTNTDHRLTEAEKDIGKVETQVEALSPRVERIDANVELLIEQMREQRNKEGGK